jgi:YebC/PmpR family DNA-binding regulatory protein
MEAGHSHWANIQHHKGKKDIARSQQFARMAKELTLVVKMEKNGNPQENPKLAGAIQKAKAMGFPKDRIEASIDKGLGRNQGSLDYSAYELHGPLKVAFIVDTACDSKNRIVANLRSWATRRGGSLAANGAFNFLFQKHGLIEVNTEGKSEDEIMEAAINAGAEDVTFESSKAVLSCKPDEDLVYAIRSALEEAKLEIITSEVILVPSTTVEISGEEDIQLFQSSMDALMEIDGVESVIHNAVLDLAEPEA